ncbi:MAG TPA: PAS domain S-box protein, partial [Myxococcales bacterium]|nr:PAS domain S-box protein [Myxococcales bacterium]
MLPDQLPVLLDHCLAGLYVLSGDRIVWLNARAAALVGSTPEKMTGGSFLEFVYPPDLPLVRANRHGGDSYVLRVVRGDGELVYLEVHQRAVLMDGERMISGAVLDVTARVRADEREREADRKLRSVLERTRFFALLLDGQGNIEFCNDAVLRATGH